MSAIWRSSGGKWTILTWLTRQVRTALLKCETLRTYRRRGQEARDPRNTMYAFGSWLSSPRSTAQR